MPQRKKSRKSPRPRKPRQASRTRCEKSYLESGAVQPATAAAMFEAAGRLHRVEPWNLIGEYQLLRLDIPELDVIGAAVSINGRVGELCGLMIFASDEAYLTFKTVLLELDGTESRIDVGADSLTLRYECGRKLTGAMRREVAANGWPLVAPDTYPLVERQDRHLACYQLTERDLRIATAAAEATCVYYAYHGDLFAEEPEGIEDDPVSILHMDRDGLAIGLSWPYSAAFHRLVPVYNPARLDPDARREYLRLLNSIPRN